MSRIYSLLDSAHDKFCTSWLSIRVSNIGTTLAIQARNKQPIPGTVYFQSMLYTRINQRTVVLSLKGKLLYRTENVQNTRGTLSEILYVWQTVLIDGFLGLMCSVLQPLCIFDFGLVSGISPLSTDTDKDVKHTHLP